MIRFSPPSMVASVEPSAYCTIPDWLVCSSAGLGTWATEYTAIASPVASSASRASSQVNSRPIRRSTRLRVLILASRRFLAARRRFPRPGWPGWAAPRLPRPRGAPGTDRDCSAAEGPATKNSLFLSTTRYFSALRNVSQHYLMTDDSTTQHQPASSQGTGASSVSNADGTDISTRTPTNRLRDPAHFTSDTVYLISRP